ncbi:SDR family NAD(P)-dependent oxidoreductase [Promicromonospora sukumoe]|uniref:SDR family NAD(P)-dependent oxidoreductase n=1 Tax=Promicromonospora sukumoe TaxID=88382 RepID=UPI0003632D6E|nr:SDR family oxidoreductase [Promicromonospora sukumoe]
MAGRLAGKKVLVTGSTSNIGAAIAERFALEGAHVVVSGRSQERGAAVVRRIREAGGRADFVAADLDGSKAASDRLAEQSLKALGGRVDVLVNNAGVFPGGPTASISQETADLVYAVNVKAPFFLVARLAPSMVERGQGTIINMGSWGARLGIAGSALYTSSKGAIETLTRSWAAEFGPSGVNVNAISPGVIREIAPEPGERGESLMWGTPVGASGRPDVIASAAVYLASDEARFVHGSVLDIDGGRTGVAVRGAQPAA